LGLTRPADSPLPPAAGLTVRDVARRYRVGGDKVRLWIARGELAAVNTAAALCGKPRFVVLPEHLAAFERRRAAAPAQAAQAEADGEGGLLPRLTGPLDLRSAVRALLRGEFCVA
jgi:hypothetical protein